MFTQNDFAKHANKLRIIVLGDMCVDVTTPFRDLSKKHQRLVNEKLNSYIKALPNDFEEKINNDFNRVCEEELFEKLNLKAGTMLVPQIDED